MSIRYFSNFPYLTYTLDPTVSIPNDIVTNLFRRVSFRDQLSLDARLFYPYTIKDGDTPEIIAHKLYGSADYYWIVTLFNNIIDPILDWPKPYRSFLSYIISKYGSIAVAQNTLHHYTKTITKTNSLGDTTITTFTIDETTYNSLTSVVPDAYQLSDGTTVTVTTTRAQVYAYDYEHEVNESRRSIKLLKVEYLEQVRAELAKVSS